MSHGKSEYKAGLDGIIVADTAICDIDGEKGELIYAGYDIRELAENVSFEEVCFLLWNLRLPKRSELEELMEAFDEEADLPETVIAILRGIARKAAPMDALRSGVSLLAHFDHDPNDNSDAGLREKAVRLTARIPMLVAAFDRLRNGKEPVPYEPGLGIAERFLYQLKGERPMPEAARAIDMALVLHAEHGFNASTFAARVTISTLSDIYSAVTSAIGTLKGPLHGGANERVIAMLKTIGEPERVESWVRSQLADKQRIFGFGHRVYKTMDPRAVFLGRMSEQLGEVSGQSKWYEMSKKVEAVVKEQKDIDPNVDFYSATVYHTIGVPIDLFTPIFAISRISGWTAHIMEQMRNNRLIRPLARYVGSRDREFVPVDER